MEYKPYWNSVKSLLLVFNYEDQEHLRLFRNSLDKILNQSNVERLLIIVNIPKEIDKKSLTPHFLIFYLSPRDFTLFGKLKDVQLEAELNSDYNALICIGEMRKKTMKLMKNTEIKKRISVNSSDNGFDLYLKTQNNNPPDLLSFVVNMLKKITFDE
jgi:hypothetical protein